MLPGHALSRPGCCLQGSEQQPLHWHGNGSAQQGSKQVHWVQGHSHIQAKGREARLCCGPNGCCLQGQQGSPQQQAGEQGAEGSSCAPGAAGLLAEGSVGCQQLVREPQAQGQQAQQQASQHPGARAAGGAGAPALPAQLGLLQPGCSLGLLQGLCCAIQGALQGGLRCAQQGGQPWGQGRQQGQGVRWQGQGQARSAQRQGRQALPWHALHWVQLPVQDKGMALERLQPPHHLQVRVSAQPEVVAPRSAVVQSQGQQQSQQQGSSQAQQEEASSGEGTEG